MCTVKLVSSLAGELPEDSEQFRFLRAVLLVNLKVPVGLILAKVSLMSYIPVPWICLRGLSYLYLVSLTLFDHLLCLIHLWSYFLNNLPERFTVCVHFWKLIGLLYIIVLAWHFFPWLSPSSFLIWCNKSSSSFYRSFFISLSSWFSSHLKSKVDNILAKTVALRINLIGGTPIPSRSHTLPSHYQTSHLSHLSLTSSLSLGVPVPCTTQCMWGV